MIRKRRCLILFLLLLSLAASRCTAEDAATLLVYMCGSELEEDAYLDLVEMAEAEADSVNIVVLAGGSSDWEIEELEGNTRNLAVIRDGGFESVEDWGPSPWAARTAFISFWNTV